MANLRPHLFGPSGSREVLLRPARDLFERRQQGTARVGELIGDGDGRSGVDGAGGEPHVAQLTESVGEHRVADAFDRAREDTEPDWAAAERPEYHPGPAPAEEVERAHERRVGASTRFGVDRRLWFRSSFHGIPLALSPLLVS